MDNDPDAALKGPEKIAVHLESQALAHHAMFPMFPGSIGGGLVLVGVLVHDQHPSCLLKATASA